MDFRDKIAHYATMDGGRSHIKDRHGNDIYFANAGTCGLHPLPRSRTTGEHLRQLRHLELRHDDVMLTSFPRSDMLWRFVVLQAAVSLVAVVMRRHSLAPPNLGHVAARLPAIRRLFNVPPPGLDPPSQLPPPDNPRVLVSHLRPRYLPQQMKQKKVKVVYCYRNPKDTWVSLYGLANCFRFIPSYDGSWHQFFDLMMEVGFWYGDWFDHVLDWEKEAAENPDRVFLSSFEEIKMDPVEQIVKIDQFLGLNRGRQLCEQIAEACQFSKLKEITDAQVPDAMKEKAWKGGVPMTFRKGEIGEWRNWFTVEENERFDAVFDHRMAESRVPFIFL